MFGVIWTTLYAMVLLASPDAIYFPETVVEVATAEVKSPTGDAEAAIAEEGVLAVGPEPSRNRSELSNFHALNYFSFVTLSTLGYGDILPISPVARMLAWLEAVFGQLYLAVLIGHIVGLQVAHVTGEGAKTQKDGKAEG
jgi:hypothetical protein